MHIYLSMMQIVILLSCMSLFAMETTQRSENNAHSYKAILFDIGGVLLKGDAKSIVEKLRKHDQSIPIELSEVTKSAAWKQWDLGTISTPELEAALCQTFKKNHVQLLMQQMLNPNREFFNKTVKISKLLKKQRYKTILASNFSHDSRATFVNNNDTLKHFDGGFFSSEVGLAKPSPEFFKKLLEIHNLNAQDCIFIDDAPANVHAAQELGITSIVFNENTLETELAKLGVLEKDSTNI